MMYIQLRSEPRLGRPIRRRCRPAPHQLPRNPLDRRYCARSPPGVPLTGAPPPPPPWATHTGTGGPLCQWSVWPYLQTLPRPLRLQLFEQQSASVVQEEPDGKHPASVVVVVLLVDVVVVLLGTVVVVVVAG